MIVKNDSIIANDAKIYDGVRVIKSNIGPKCCIGQDSDILDSTMDEHAELGRRNLIRNSFIGKGSYTGTNTVIKNTVIGKYCCISWNVSIGGGNHDYKKTALYNNYWFNRTFGVDNFETEEKHEETIIGNDVWIGAGVNIINGVTIGDGAVIGAGAVVTCDVQPYSMVVGVPARCYKMRFSDDVIRLLEKVKWWDWSEEKIKKNISLLQSEPSVEILEKYLEELDEA